MTTIPPPAILPVIFVCDDCNPRPHFQRSWPIWKRVMCDVIFFLFDTRVCSWGCGQSSAITSCVYVLQILWNTVKTTVCKEHFLARKNITTGNPCEKHCGWLQKNFHFSFFSINCARFKASDRKALTKHLKLLSAGHYLCNNCDSITKHNTNRHGTFLALNMLHNAYNTSGVLGAIMIPPTFVWKHAGTRGNLLSCIGLVWGNQLPFNYQTSLI